MSGPLSVEAHAVSWAIKNQVRALEDMLTVAVGLGVVDGDAAGRLREQLRALEGAQP